MTKFHVLAMTALSVLASGCSTAPTVEEDIPKITTEKAIYQAGLTRSLDPLRLLHAEGDQRQVSIGLKADRDGVQSLIIQVNRASEITGVTFVVEGRPERLAADPASTTYRLSGDGEEHDFALSSIPIPSVFLEQLSKAKPVHVVVHTMMGDFNGSLQTDEPSPALTGIREWLD